jgi:hypothetical protein
MNTKSNSVHSIKNCSSYKIMTRGKMWNSLKFYEKRFECGT